MAFNCFLLLTLFAWWALLVSRGPFFWRDGRDRIIHQRRKIKMRLQLEILCLKLCYLWQQLREGYKGK